MTERTDLTVSQFLITEEMSSSVNMALLAGMNIDVSAKRELDRDHV